MMIIINFNRSILLIFTHKSFPHLLLDDKMIIYQSKNKNEFMSILIIQILERHLKKFET
jgi:hypothetical protein